MERTEKQADCWLWFGPKNAKGYGLLSVKGQHWSAHRLSYHVHKGPIPKGMLVCHSCDVRNCVNPDHLWLGTNDDNQLDAWKKGRKRMQSATHCERGHEYTPENTRRPPSTGRRVCIACARGRFRIRAGWPEHLAYSVPVIPPGAKTERRHFKFGRRQKLTDEQARRAKFSDEHPSVLAKEFGVTDTAIRAIRDGRTWRHIT